MGIIKTFKGLFTAENKIDVQHNVDTVNQIVSLSSKGEVINHISYDDLVSNIKEDHEKILNIYHDILTHLYQTDFKDITHKLRHFKLSFNEHLYMKNIKLYVVLEQHLKDQEEKFLTMRKHRREMRTIEITINRFLSSWIDSGVHAETIQQFEQEFQLIGDELNRRIHNEETYLHPLYKQCA